MIIIEHFNSSRMKCRVKNVDVIVLIVVRKEKTQVVAFLMTNELQFHAVEHGRLSCIHERL